MALVGSVESLENPLLMLGRNTDSRIRNNEAYFLLGFAYLNLNPSAVLVIFNGIVAKVIDYLEKKLVNSDDTTLVSLNAYVDSFFTGAVGYYAADLL